MALYTCRQGTNQKADQISAAEDHAQVDHRHGKKLVRYGPGILNESAEFAERHGRRQQPCGQPDGQEMQELIAYIRPGSVAEWILSGELHFGEIDQQVNERQAENHKACSRQEQGTPQDKASDDDGGEIVNEPVKQIARSLSAPLLLDEAGRLKNKIGQQMGQVNRQKGSKEDLHDSVQVSVLVRFRTTSKKRARLTIQPP